MRKAGILIILYLCQSVVALEIIPSLSPLKYITPSVLASATWDLTQKVLWNAVLPVDSQDSVAIFISEGHHSYRCNGAMYASVDFLAFCHNMLLIGSSATIFLEFILAFIAVGWITLFYWWCDWMFWYRAECISAVLFRIIKQTIHGMLSHLRRIRSPWWFRCKRNFFDWWQ